MKIWKHSEYIPGSDDLDSESSDDYEEDYDDIPTLQDFIKIMHVNGQ